MFGWNVPWGSGGGGGGGDTLGSAVLTESRAHTSASNATTLFVADGQPFQVTVNVTTPITGGTLSVEADGVALVDNGASVSVWQAGTPPDGTAAGAFSTYHWTDSGAPVVLYGPSEISVSATGTGGEWELIVSQVAAADDDGNRFNPLTGAYDLPPLAGGDSNAVRVSAHASFEAALDAAIAGGKALHVDQATSTGDLTKTLTSDLEIFSEGAYKIAFDAGATLDFIPTRVLTTTLTANVAEDATTFTLDDVTGIEPEMTLVITSNERSLDSEQRTTLQKRYVGKVASVVGSDVTCWHPTLHSFETAASVPIVGGSGVPTITVEVYEKKNLKIKNLHLEGGVDGLINGRPNFILAKGFNEVLTEDLEFTNRDETWQGAISETDGTPPDRVTAESSEAWLQAVYAVDCISVVHRNLKASHIGYVCFSLNVRGTRVFKAHGYQCRHVTIQNQSSDDYYAEDVTGEDCWAVIDSHQGSFRSKHVRCRSFGDVSPTGGASMRGRFDHLVECETDGVKNIYADPGLQDYEGEVSPVGFRLERCRFDGGLLIEYANKEIDIIECDIPLIYGDNNISGGVDRLRIVKDGFDSNVFAQSIFPEWRNYRRFTGATGEAVKVVPTTGALTAFDVGADQLTLMWAARWYDETAALVNQFDWSIWLSGNTNIRSRGLSARRITMTSPSDDHTLTSVPEHKNKVTYWALTINAGTLQLFMNGVPLGEEQFAISAMSGSPDFWLGNRTIAGTQPSGTVDLFGAYAAFSKVLTAEEIRNYFRVPAMALEDTALELWIDFSTDPPQDLGTNTPTITVEP